MLLAIRESQMQLIVMRLIILLAQQKGITAGTRGGHKCQRGCEQNMMLKNKNADMLSYL